MIHVTVNSSHEAHLGAKFIQHFIVINQSGAIGSEIDIVFKGTGITTRWSRSVVIQFYVFEMAVNEVLLSIDKVSFI